MRWYSTPKSAEASEISILGLVETVFAVSVSLWLVVEQKTVIHVLLGGLLAPLLLLRTARSTSIGIEVFKSLLSPFHWRVSAETFQKIIPEVSRFEPSEKKIGCASFALACRVIFCATLVLFYVVILFSLYAFSYWSLQLLFLLVGFPVAALIARIYAIVRVFVMNPQASIAAIPKNWFRVVFCVDLAHPPEAVPGSESLSSQERGIIPTIGELKHEIPAFREEHGILPLILVCVLVLPVYTLLLLPALAYRFSLKSTSIIYLPLIWVVNVDQVNSDDRYFTLREIQAEYLKRRVAWFVLSMLGVTIVSYAVYQRWYYPLDTGEEFLQYWIPIEYVGSWHVTRVISALLTLTLAWYANRTTLRLEVNESFDFSRDVFWLSAGKRLRAFCSLWTIGCGLYLAYHAVDWTTLPEWLWLPKPPSAS